jgi:hypothetical protein
MDRDYPGRHEFHLFFIQNFDFKGLIIQSFYMKLFFVTKADSKLADDASRILKRMREALLETFNVQETRDPDLADALILQEKKSIKDFKYVHDLICDPVISKYAHKVFTVNEDKYATGLIRGLYTTLPKFRFNIEYHVAVPFMQYPNEYVLSNIGNEIKPCYLASWRGNINYNSLRKKMIDYHDHTHGILLEQTNCCFNYDSTEKIAFVTIVKNAKFSLCPAGSTPVNHRIYESMALGRCPVIISDQFVLPIGPKWKSCALFFRERDLINLESYLKIHESDHKKLGDNAFSEWQRHFSPNNIAKYYANALMSILQKPHSKSAEKEIQRWTSFGVYWNNKWTLPQRIMDRAKRIMVKQHA